VNAQFTDEAVPLSADDLLLALALELVDADEEQRLWSDPG
jgi:hypothetical protein